MKVLKYIRTWFRDWYQIMSNELRMIFSDSGVMIIFFLAGLAYPVIYNLVYGNDMLEDMPVAAVDLADCAQSRDFIRKLDATREVSIVSVGKDMAEAEDLLRKREVNGIVMFPQDYGKMLSQGRQATVSTYADMSSFLYYKNLLIATNTVMLDRMHSIQEGRGLSRPVLYEENIPYNRAFSYGIFFLSAALMIVIQQTMFYGISMLAGTMREENRSFATLPDRLAGRGISRTVLGRGAAYWLIYMVIGVYVAAIVPRLFGFPQNGRFADILVLLLFYVSACVVFCFTFSTLIDRRETVFVLFLFMSPVCLFLTGFSWPTSSFPTVWRWFSYLFPSTFAAQAFINMNTAGADLAMVSDQITALTLQTVIYYVISCVAVRIENLVIRRRSRTDAAR